MLVWTKKPMAVKFRSQHKHRKPRRQPPKMMPPQRACRRSKTKELGWECRRHVGSMSSTRVRMHNMPKTSKYIRSLVYNKIRALSEIFLLTTTTHNNQQSHTALPSTSFSPLSPWLGQWHHQLMVPPLHRLAQGAHRQVRQRRCWFPCLGCQREPYQKKRGRRGLVLRWLPSSGKK